MKPNLDVSIIPDQLLFLVTEQQELEKVADRLRKFLFSLGAEFSQKRVACLGLSILALTFVLNIHSGIGCPLSVCRAICPKSAGGTHSQEKSHG
ncbi:hypothetical protein BaRGS_00008001 [Batillaria attramentaria]|uniref:Uncharacterized protein n=1 Tax=Batillaria attramentaria TaxID=370345 RepID=A0ABD0LNY2_9CAEN